MGLTADLSLIGKLVIIIIMFTGKLGPFTLALSLVKTKSSSIRYFNEDVLTG
ncbi:hypothetical protein J6TS2_38470 [Heyndrickxia sporothermodurans]|nr:hypothetical protein J6TS2_38470 [Heyndrickxia sporothermodurans]